MAIGSAWSAIFQSYSAAWAWGVASRAGNRTLYHALGVKGQIYRKFMVCMAYTLQA